MPNLPILQPNFLTHIGTLDPRTQRRGGYEGKSLSVSVHPQAWRQIARLGGNPLWILSKPNIGLLNVHALSKDQTEAICAELAGKGLLEKATAWKVSHEDDELEQTVFVLCSSRDEAEAEAEGYEPEDIEEISVWKATPALTAAVGDVGSQLGDSAVDMAMLFAAQEAGLDGAWWNEQLHPAHYSAPRGCIFQGRIGSFATRRERWDQMDDSAYARQALPGIKFGEEDY